MLNKKIFVILLFFIMIIGVYGETTFPNSITIKSYNYIVNITTEEDSKIFDCNQNTTSSYIFNLKRNVSSYDDVSKINRNIDKLLSTCDSFETKYGDVSKYFELYSTCNAENKICQKDIQDKDKELNGLRTYKSGYESLNTELTTITGNVIPIMKQNASILYTNLTLCNQALVNEGDNKILWGFAGAIIIGLFWGYQKRKETHITKRSKMPNQLAPR